MKNSKFEIRNWLGLLATLFVLQSVAQINNSLISDKITLNQSDSNTWGISVTNFNYLRNTEYFNDIEVGRTLFGYQLHPSLFIQPNNHVKLQAGVFVQSDFGGNTGYSKVLPTFSVKINSSNGKRSFIFGTLEGALAHRLVEPLFDINSAIERRIENGAQFKSETEKLFVDAWINWEQFIERGSPFKEQFTAGISTNYKVAESTSGIYLSLPIQLIAHHHGGQINKDTLNMTMQLNGAVGLQLGQIKKGWIEEWRIDGYVTGYKENSNSGYFPYRNGTGFYANLFLRKGSFGAMGSYWQGNQWITPRGTTLYSSVSLDNPGLTQANRSLIFLRFMYQKPLSDGLSMSARLEPVYDVQKTLLEYSYSLYISYKLNQKMGSIKK